MRLALRSDLMGAVSRWDWLTQGHIGKLALSGESLRQTENVLIPCFSLQILHKTKSSGKLEKQASGAAKLKKDEREVRVPADRAGLPLRRGRGSSSRSRLT